MINKFARIMRDSAVLRMLLPIGLILVVVGCILTFSGSKNLIETKATVTEVEDAGRDTENNRLYNVYFEYVVEGKTYQSFFDHMSGEEKKGTVLTIYYDPDNPGEVSNVKNSALIGLIPLIAGIAALSYGIFSAVKNFKKSAGLDQDIREKGGFTEIPKVDVPALEAMTEYYVLFDGKHLTPGYIVEDRQRQPVYEMTMTKNSLTSARTFTFTNHVTGEVREHAVGHTTTVHYNEEFFSARSWFRFDGKNVWEVLHEAGIRIETDLISIVPRVRYTVSLNGVFFGLLETTSVNVHEEDEAQHKLNVPVGQYYYRCWTNRDDLDLLFLTVFAISETEQAVVE